MKRDELVHYLDEYLQIDSIQDYGPQGLQIQGRDEVHRVLGFVDAHQPCVDAAQAQGADLMLVHHGIFWGGPRPLRGAYGELVRRFFQAELNLYAAHLVLDGHREVGNNAELARRLELPLVDWWGEIHGVPLAALAESPEPISLETLVARFEAQVGPVKLLQAYGPSRVRRVGILSGQAASHISEAARLGCDLFITGETSHAHYYDALEEGINVLYGGHYATETVGVQALGRHLQEKFDLEFQFVDLPTGL